MALAAALSATGTRPASFLPTITCSSCAAEIEIAAMGEHICASTVAEPTERRSRASSMSNPFRLRKYGAADESASASSAPSETAGVHSGSTRPPRIALPKINSDAANRAFLAPRKTGPRTPITPAVSGHSGSSDERPRLSRSTTTPMPRLHDPRPPSPELTANLDSAFPRFPTQAAVSGRSTPSNGRVTPIGSDRAPSRAQTLEPDSLNMGPKSPGLVSQRFETLKTGPFTARRQGTGDSKEDSAGVGHKNPSQVATEEQRAPSPTDPRVIETQEAERKDPPPRPARLSYDQLSPVLLERFSAEPDNMFPLPPQSRQGADRDGSSLALLDQSHDYSSSHTLSTAREESVLRLPERKASLSTADTPPTSTSPPSGTVLPKRSSSRVGTRMDYRMQNAPPVPRPVQQHRNYSSHTHSESGSSTMSSANTYSSGHSPISSAASSLDHFSPLSMAATSHEELEQMRPVGLSVRGPQEPGLRAELPPHRSPPRKFRRPSVDTSQKVDKKFASPLESPMDPALRLGAPYEPWEPVTPDSATSGIRANHQFISSTDLPIPNPTIPSLPAYATSPRSASPLSPRAVDNQQRPSRPTPVKPACRGCGLVIEGKSVKAADGRLTGRWHKSCFVCRTCEQPFATAEFYVINDNAYCEHHYHEKNGSLCNGCHRGIEGQYLETTSTTRWGNSEKKFHPRCFTCSTCHEVLSEDYFELGGKVLCERHAMAVMRQQQLRMGPRMDKRNIYAERRTTRLINPMRA